MNKNRVCCLLLLVGVAGAQAQTHRYDLLLKGGHVIDPANGINRVMDIAGSESWIGHGPRHSWPRCRKAGTRAA